MKRYITLLLAAAIALSLFSGCRTEESPTSAPTENTTQQTQPSETTVPATQPPETTAPATQATETQPTEPAPTQETQPVETAPPETVPPETAPTETEGFSSYLQKIKRATQSIFDGPGFDYGFVGTVEVAGTYTIVDEAWDYEGNLWGKLKSGVGWVNLTEIQSPETYVIPISVNYASKRLLDSGNYQHCIADTSEYMVQIAFYADEPLTDFSLVSLQFADSGFEVAEMFFYTGELTPEQPLLADVAFPGDMSTYGIQFTDADGVVHQCYITQSGRNGTLVMYKPGS